jgi:hypothetical protein
MNRWLVFATEADAVAAEAAIWQAMEPTVVETRDGVPVNPRVTQRWATPAQLADGRWAIPSPDGTGETLVETDFDAELNLYS